MRRWAFLLLFSACSTTTPCLDLVEQACLMAKEKAKNPKGEPEEAQKACDEAKARAEKSDDAMNAQCAESLADFRKGLLAPKSNTPKLTPNITPK